MNYCNYPANNAGIKKISLLAALISNYILMVHDIVYRFGKLCLIVIITDEENAVKSVRSKNYLAKG